MKFPVYTPCDLTAIPVQRHCDKLRKVTLIVIEIYCMQLAGIFQEDVNKIRLCMLSLNGTRALAPSIKAFIKAKQHKLINIYNSSLSRCF
jgi:hypothetical protein